MKSSIEQCWTIKEIIPHRKNHNVKKILPVGDLLHYNRPIHSNQTIKYIGNYWIGNLVLYSSVFYVFRERCRFVTRLLHYLNNILNYCFLFPHSFILPQSIRVEYCKEFFQVGHILLYQSPFNVFLFVVRVTEIREKMWPESQIDN